MTPDLLGRKLASPNPRERLEAARYLAEHALPRHGALIEQALGSEGVAWVAGALKRALLRARPQRQSVVADDRAELSPEHTAQIYSEALETTAKQIIHEIEPILGALRLSAQMEVPAFDASDTKRGLDRLESLVASLARLRRAASAPRIQQFALDECIYEWIAEETGGKPVSIVRAGPQGFLIDADRGLIWLCFANGLRNAIDATLAGAAHHGDPADITVNWNATDVDVWISIVDAGIGFRGNVSRAFEIGSTTKAGHLGMGLATAQQAMTSMGGTVRLIPQERGVRFEMRWPKAGS